MTRGEVTWLKADRPTIRQVVPAEHDEAYDVFVHRAKIYGTVVSWTAIDDEFSELTVRFPTMKAAREYIECTTRG